MGKSKYIIAALLSINNIKREYVEYYQDFVISDEIANLDIGGNEFKTIYLMRDDSRYMRYLARIIDDYMFSISIIAPTLDEVDSVLDNFS